MNKEYDRKKFLNYAWKSGLLIQSKDFTKLKTDKERYQRLRTLISDGYKIVLYGGERIDIINVQGKTISSEINNELREAFKELEIIKFNADESFVHFINQLENNLGDLPAKQET